MCVKYPTSSFGNDSALNPDTTNAFEPKLEFELLIEKSPPDSTEKCCANPIANTDTN